MADASAAPRPRPRPRPRPTAKSSSSNNTTANGPSTQGSSGASGSSTQIPLASTSAGGAKRVIEVHDTDEMFMRNTNRTYKTWQRLEEIEKKMSKVHKGETPSSDNDSDRDNSASPRRNHKKKKAKSDLPSWQNTQKMSRLLSQDLSEHDSDSDIEFLGESTPNAKANGKRKRPERSRSRSITPPPSVPQHQIQTAKDLVRRALNITNRPPSPKFDADDSTDTIVLLPELSAIAQEIKRKPHLYSSPAPDAAAVGAGEHIVINVTWHPHPKAVGAEKQEWQYRIDRTESFRDLFEAVADDAGIPSSNVVMTYQHNRFFPSITPLTLKIWSDTANLDAYEQTTWKYMQEQQQHDTSRYTTSQVAASSTFTGASSSRNTYTHAHLKPTNITTTTSGPIEIDSDSDEDIQVLGFTSTTSNSQYTTTQSQTHTQFSLPTPPPYSQPLESDTESQPSFGGPHSHQPGPEEDDHDHGTTLKLTLRSSLTPKNITLTVRPTTKCGAVVRAFLKKAGLEAQYPEVFEEGGVAAGGGAGGGAAAGGAATKKKGRKSKATTGGGGGEKKKDPRLCIDGDKMDNATEIGEMDLEDGDMVEVVGL